VQLQGVAQELLPVQTLQQELALTQQLVLVLVLVQVPEQELQLQLAQALLLVRQVRCDRCSQVHLLA
jgi:hypothetical protein